MSYVCPKCKTPEGLWRGVDVPGWESIDGDLKPLSRGSLDREVEWGNAEADGAYGCGECNWEGGKSDLVALGLDGEPLPAIHPGLRRSKTPILGKAGAVWTRSGGSRRVARRPG